MCCGYDAYLGIKLQKDLVYFSLDIERAVGVRLWNWTGSSML